MNDIQENRLFIFKRDKFTCHCGNPITRFGTPQLGHIIPQKKMYLKKYGAEIIHHPMNMKSCCCLKCNSKVDLGFKDAMIAIHAEMIIRTIERQKKLDIN